MIYWRPMERFTTGELIRYAMNQFRAERKQRFIHAGGQGRTVHGPGERILWLPHGGCVKVSVDDSGVATQVEEDENLHAVVRPSPIRMPAALGRAFVTSPGMVRPRSIRTAVIPRRHA